MTDVKDPDGNVIDGGSFETSATDNAIDLSQYTKDGYTYANTRILGHGDNGRIIYPNLRLNSSGRLICTTDSTNNANSTGNTRNFQNGEEVYVVLDPVPSGGSGGGSGGGTTPIADLPDPETSKTLTDNQDGTYDLNLSITGKSDTKQENKNINVLFVIDNSSSMGSGSGSRLENTKQAVKDSAKELLKYNSEASPKLVEVAAVSFDQDANDVCSWTASEDMSMEKLQASRWEMAQTGKMD